MSALSYASYILTIAGFALIGIGTVMAIFEMTIKRSAHRKNGVPIAIMRRVSISSIVIIGIGVTLVLVGI